MPRDRVTIIHSARSAADVVLENRELAQLYYKAVRRYGEGELNTKILESAVKAVESEEVRQEVFSNHDSMFSLLCGIWIQFLLSEIAGIRQDTLETMVQKIFMDSCEDKVFH